MYSVIAERVSKAYGDNVALDGVDLTIPDGGVVALLGPNGAGKTSLVEILEGHRQRTSGALSVLGRDPGDHDDFAVLRTQIGVVLQHTMLEQNVSSRDLLRRQASYYASPVSIDRLLDDVELTGKKHAQVRTLSGGMKRRLDIALALVGRPKLLFLDEPRTQTGGIRRYPYFTVFALAA